MDFTLATFKKELLALLEAGTQVILLGIMGMISIGMWIICPLHLWKWFGGHVHFLMGILTGTQDFDAWGNHISLLAPTHYAIREVVLLISISVFLHYSTRETSSRLLAIPQRAWQWAFPIEDSRADARKLIVYGTLLPIRLMVYGKIVYTAIHLAVPLYR